MKPVRPKQALAAVAAALLIVALTGCQFDPTREFASTTEPDTVTASPITDAGSKPNSPQKTYNERENGNGKQVSDELAADGNATTADARTESSNGSGKSPAAESEQTWNAKAPKLLGIAIGESKATASDRLGKPIDSYALDDDKDKLSVDEYAAYSIGYTASQKVRFVEAFDKSATTGLNGLRVGDTGKSAVKLLGKPATQTSSVLSYPAEGALLKLDLDPRNGRIVSIKLFSA